MRVLVCFYLGLPWSADDGDDGPFCGESENATILGFKNQTWEWHR